jgi:hypothetical protein
MARMHLTAVVPGSLVPAPLAAELTASLQAPTLARLLRGSSAASESTSAPGLADATWLAREVYGVPPPAPTAPYAWAALVGSRDAQLHLWQADPVHIAIGRDSLIVQDLGNAMPSEAEANALITAANETLRPAGCTLQRKGAWWFLRADRAWTMTPRPLSAVLGQPLPVTRADDGDALHWSRLLNEIQMRWHADPVNRDREAQGLPVINSLWLHGGGTWRSRTPLRWPRVHTQRFDLQGLAIAAGATIAKPDDAVNGDALLVWDDALAFAREADWSGWLVAMRAIDCRLASLPPSATLELVMTGRERIRVRCARPSDRYCFWRRTALAQALTE